MSNNLLDTFKQNLPIKPYCTDELPLGLQIRPLEAAIRKRYIQYNKPTDLRWFVYDVDRPSAHFDWQDVRVPSPNITVTNPINGHAHLMYALEVPVYMQMSARQNPIRFAAAIDVAMIRALAADEGYSELICKNPLHKSWDTNVWRDRSYDLHEMADWLDMPSSLIDKRRKLPEIGLGRNCNLFDFVRRWAYKDRRKPVDNVLFDEMYTMDDFINRCIQYAFAHNVFSIPLPERECISIGKSVGKWTYRNMSPEGFLQWSENRRKKSIEVRSAKAKEKANLIKDYKLKNPLATVRDIALALNISKSTVDRLLKK